MPALDKRSGLRRRSWLSPYLLVVALSPALLQSGESLSCESGDTTLAELSVFVGGGEQLAFEPSDRRYEVLLAEDTVAALVRAIPNDPDAQVWVNLYMGSELTEALSAVVVAGR